MRKVDSIRKTSFKKCNGKNLEKYFSNVLHVYSILIIILNIIFIIFRKD